GAVLPASTLGQNNESQVGPGGLRAQACSNAVQIHGVEGLLGDNNKAGVVLQGGLQLVETRTDSRRDASVTQQPAADRGVASPGRQDEGAGGGDAVRNGRCSLLAPSAAGR